MLSLCSGKTKNPKISTHKLKIMYTAEKTKIRRMCTGCYALIKEAEGRDAARKKSFNVLLRLRTTVLFSRRMFWTA